MASTGKDDKVADNIRDSYVQSRTIGDVSHAEHTYDGAVESVSSLPDSGPLAFVKTFYDNNQDTIKATATGIANLTSEGVAIETTVSKFVQTANIIIKGLEALAQVHPAIGVAVIAFKLVVTLDMTRRENNKKVLALKIEMQDMMTVLFELRNIRDPMELGPDGLPLGARIQNLMDGIADDIRDAGSACDAYLKKSFLARTLKSKIYETRLAEYGSKFEDNKTDIQRSLAMHTARGVDMANEKLDAQGLKIDEMARKVDQVMEIFRQLDSPRELEIQEFLESQGGAKACIDDDGLLWELVSKSGQTLLEATRSVAQGDGLASTRRVLLKEFKEDVDQMFDNHFIVFQGKLDIHSKQLDTIQALLTSGSHDRIVDQDLKAIWKEMGWRGSVKARHFVLALHDYFSDGSFFGIQKPSGSIEFPSSPSNITHTTPMASERWGLSYVNVTHVQPILEAIDDDATGFISIKEVNTFVTDPPLDWTLLQRLAFWAAGWHISISSYKTKIYALIRRMYKLVEHVIPENRRLVNDYLLGTQILRLECILRSTQSAGITQDDPELKKLIDMFENIEEERLRKNLSAVAYDLDSVETVGLVTGPGRIERYLFPLVYLLLDHDLRIVLLACKYAICQEELWTPLASLYYVFSLVDERLGQMTGILKQVHADVHSRFGILAFGMFQRYYDVFYTQSPDNFPASIQNNSFFNLEADSSTVDAQSLQAEIASIPVTELKFGTYRFEVTGGLDTPQQWDIAEIPDDLSILGRWSGHLWYIRPDNNGVSVHGLIELQINTLSGGEFSGDGQISYNLLTAQGTLDGSGSNNLSLTVRTNTGYTMICSGEFSQEFQRIFAQMTSDNRDAWENVEQKPFFSFWRTPNHLNRFRAEMRGYENLALGRWAFARQSILYEVRRQAWSSAFFKARLEENKRFMSLAMRNWLKRNYETITSYTALNEEETEEFLGVQQDIPTPIARICSGLIEFHGNRILVRHE